MPNTCRTDTFMSGKPAGSSSLVMAAVVINPPRSRALPKPDLLTWLRMGAVRNLAERSGRQKPAASKVPCKVPSHYHQDRRLQRFLEGCPANQRVLATVLPDRAAQTGPRGKSPRPALVVCFAQTT